MNVLIVGCGWVGTYIATGLRGDGHQIWATVTSPEKAQRLAQLGLFSQVVDFDREDPVDRLDREVFDVVIVSVPIRRKDHGDVVARRFANLLGFLDALSFKQSFFFGSVGIYPDVSTTITENTFHDTALDPKLRSGESMLRRIYPDLNILRLGGLFGLERILAKYFVGKVCDIGCQPANFVHVVDIYGIIQAMIGEEIQGKTYNVVCPEHPLKKEVIEASATKYGYGLPSAFSEADQTAKVVSSQQLLTDLGYRFRYRSPLQF